MILRFVIPVAFKTERDFYKKKISILRKAISTMGVQPLLNFDSSLQTNVSNLYSKSKEVLSLKKNACLFLLSFTASAEQSSPICFMKLIERKKKWK